jgi:hypothetical protein
VLAVACLGIVAALGLPRHPPDNTCANTCANTSDNTSDSTSDNAS